MVTITFFILYPHDSAAKRGGISVLSPWLLTALTDLLDLYNGKSDVLGILGSDVLEILGSFWLDFLEQLGSDTPSGNPASLFWKTQ